MSPPSGFRGSYPALGRFAIVTDMLPQGTVGDLLYYRNDASQYASKALAHPPNAASSGIWSVGVPEAVNIANPVPGDC